jgi:hypothetical protein
MIGCWDDPFRNNGSPNGSSDYIYAMVSNIPNTLQIISSSHLKIIQGIRVPVEEESDKPSNLCVSGLMLRA